MNSRLMVVKISSLLLTDLLQYGTPSLKVVENRLPDDAKLVRVYYEDQNIAFVFESESFEPVEEGSAIPYLNPVVKFNDMKLRG